MRITLKKAVVEKCIAFAEDCSGKENSDNFSQSDAKKRDRDRVRDDTFIGKLGEEAVAAMMKKFGINVTLDYSITARGQWDNNDINYRNWSIDVKCTKQSSRYFLIEWNKLQFRADCGELPQYFIMTVLGFPFQGLNNFTVGDCVVDCVGYVSTLELEANNPKVVTVKKGDVIPESRSEAKSIADNFAISLRDLHDDWQALVERITKEQPFSLAGYKAPGVVKKAPKEAGKPVAASMPMQYSWLKAANSCAAVPVAAVENLIKQGIKVLLFLPKNQSAAYAELAQKYKRENFMLYQVDAGVKLPELEIIDGRMDKHIRAGFDKLSQLPMNTIFNFEQYLVEHADVGGALIVKASAGTGKTAVMIDRVMFLLATVSGLQPKDIGLITFTNKAATSMMEKLQTRILQMYRVTGKHSYFVLLEQLAEMQISTIDSFFKKIIVSEGSQLGYGTNVGIRSFVHEKKRILQEIIDDLCRQEEYRDLLEHNVLTINDYVKYAYWMWEELHSRGYYLDDIYNMDFGTACDDKNEIINTNLKRIIIEAEKRYQHFKLANNAFTIGDIKADMDALAKSNAAVKRQHVYKFLFIDEFQDTDNSQIHSLAWMSKTFNCQLFVVGDVKQSIYRFRGAEETAFNELENTLLQQGMPQKNIKVFVLTKNYRTSANIMGELNRLFRTWHNKNMLVWDADVQSCIADQGHIRHYKYGKYTKKEERAEIALRDIRELMEQSKHVTILCRSNNKVSEIASLCRENGITCIAVLNGGFYQSKPVRDFFALLGALLHPDDNIHVFNLLQSPYVKCTPDMAKIVALNGDEAKVRAYFASLLEQDNWCEIQQKVRTLPFFTLVDKIFARKPLNNMQAYRWAENPLYQETTDAEIDIEYYCLNLNKLMRLLYEHFSGDYATLLDVFCFLENKIATDKAEDLVYPDLQGKDCIVEAMTVHKAKGLEFDAVLVPFVTTPFFDVKTAEGEIIQRAMLITDSNSNPVKVGWAVPNRRDPENKWHNEYCEKMEVEEKQAVRREEARLLYVALTRTQRLLHIITPSASEMDTWGEYLNDVREVR